VKLDDYLVAIKNLKKHKEGTVKQLLKLQLDKYAYRDLNDNEYTTFELLFDLYLTEDFIKDVLYPDSTNVALAVHKVSGAMTEVEKNHPGNRGVYFVQSPNPLLRFVKEGVDI